MMNTLLKPLCYAIFISWAWAASALAAAEELNATVDRNVISMDETLTLTLQYTGNSARGTPDFSKLEENFSILSRESGNKIFGDMSNLTALTQWTLVLRPKAKGEFMIPVFSFGNLKSAPIIVTVEEEKAAPKGELKDIFIETVVEKNSVYVQEQLIVKYRLFYSVNVDSLEREAMDIADVIIEQLPDVRYNRTINGTVYGIAEFNYAFYPQTSESFEIPSFTWDIKIPKSRRSRSTLFDFNGRYEIKRLRTEAQSVDVQPKAAAFPDAATWLPARKLVLEEKWSKDPQKFKIGEPITRTLRLKAEGLTAAQLPQIWPSQNEGAVKVYTDKPELNDEKLASGTVAQRIESAAVVVSESGTIELPAIRVPWWDVTTNSLKYAELAGQTIQVASPAGTQASASESLANQADTQLLSVPSEVDSAALSAAQRQIWLWRLVSVALGLALLFQLVHQYFVKPAAEPRKTAGPSSRSAALSQLEKACRGNGPQPIRQALIQWASREWPKEAITTLDGISKRINDGQLSRALREVDAAIYASTDASAQPDINGKAIIDAIKAYLAHKNTDARNDALEELYAS